MKSRRPAPSRSYRPEPRILTSRAQVAALLGRSETWFRDNRARLEAAGFPARDALLGGWDRAAIDRFLDARGGIGTGSPGTNAAADAWIDAAGK